MSLILPNILCSSLISISGLIVVKLICGNNKKINNIKSIILMIFLIVFSIVFHDNQYSYIYSVFIYFITVFTYKEILNISIIKSIISSGIMLIGLISLDFIMSPVVACFMTISQVRNSAIVNIFLNIEYAFILILIFSRNRIRSKLPHLVEKLSLKKAIKVVIAIIISFISFIIILYTLGNNFSINSIFTKNFLLFIVFFLLMLSLLGERNNYERLSDDYDSLFKYIQIFEDWIEKEQLTRHEYKNQLAVLRDLTKEKKVKNKIDNIVEDFIDIDNQMISQLKNIPNGGLKGLLYYKISIARKNKIDITIDIDETSGKILSKLHNDKQKVLTKLLGIYLDNAIEAASDTKNKYVSVEIYMLKEKIKIVISNSYNKKIDITNINMKGKSTKGNGRGNGLYFALKLISANSWIEQKQEIKGNYYIQSLIITK